MNIETAVTILSVADDRLLAAIGMDALAGSAREADPSECRASADGAGPGDDEDDDDDDKPDGGGDVGNIDPDDDEGYDDDEDDDDEEPLQVRQLA
ncbi:MAG TPA: hypothetical protein VFJ48_00995 [Casimicrobiaceae bacterium]|nr:hypothetical protein [Casimicrobiaceae bacterium]